MGGGARNLSWFGVTMPNKLFSIPFPQPTRHYSNVPAQLLRYIPRGIAQAAARESGVDGKARTFPVSSNLKAMVFVYFAHVFTLNDVCGWLRLKRRAVAGLGVTPPTRCSMQTKDALRTSWKRCPGARWPI